MEVSKPKDLRLIESGSMIQQRLGFFVPLLILTSQKRYPNWEQLSFSLYSFVKDQQWKWLWQPEQNIKFYGHRGIPSPETAIEYVKWAMDLNILERGMVWSSAAPVLYIASGREAKKWLGERRDDEDINPLALNAVQQTLLLKLLLEADGTLCIPFLSNVSMFTKERGSIGLIDAAQVLISTLQTIAVNLEGSDDFEHISYGTAMRTQVSSWQTELKERLSRERKGQSSAEHRVTPRLEASVDLSLLKKDPAIDPYGYEPQVALKRFVREFTEFDDQTQKHFFEKVSRTYGFQARPATKAEIRRILLRSHLLLKDNRDMSIRPTIRLFASLSALHQEPHLILEEEQADNMIEAICKDNPTDAYILVNEFGQPVFVHIEEKFAKRGLN